MALSGELRDLEKDKFEEVNGKPAIRASIVGGTIQVATGTVEETNLIDIVSDNLFYFGFAAPSTLTSEPKWKIQRLTIVGSLIKIEYASGNSNYVNIWDNRGGLTYV